MFTLCKTVIVYNTLSQYTHRPRHPAPQVDQHEINFEEQQPPLQRDSPKNSTIQSIESHTINLKRTGISLSIKSKASQASPHKSNMTSSTKHRDDHLSVSEAQNIKIRAINQENCDSPLAVESQITWGDLSPRLKGYESRDTRLTAPEQESGQLCFLPLKKITTRTTNNSEVHSSLRNSIKKQDCVESPLKKSTNFLRSSNAKMEESINSNIQKIVDQKLNNSHIRREEVSQSLLQLSCSSYTEVLSKPRQITHEQFEHTCSLQFKRQSQCLEDYVDEVTESVIINQTMQSHQDLKMLKANSDFRKHSEPNDLSQSYLNMLDRNESPVKRVKNKHENGLLTLYDKDTIVSKSANSRMSSQPRQIIDQSLLIEHQIGNKFIPIPDSVEKYEQYCINLAKDTVSGMLVSTKEVSLDRLTEVNQELNIYRQMEQYDLNVDILKLYQMYINGDAYVLIKEPYQITFQRYVQFHSKGYPLVSWQLILKSIEDTLQRTILALLKRGLQLIRPITTQDIVYVLGQWKLHSPIMFGCCSQPLSLKEAISSLRENVLKRLRESSFLTV